MMLDARIDKRAKADGDDEVLMEGGGLLSALRLIDMPYIGLFIYGE